MSGNNKSTGPKADKKSAKTAPPKNTSGSKATASKVTPKKIIRTTNRGK